MTRKGFHTVETVSQRTYRVFQENYFTIGFYRSVCVCVILFASMRYLTCPLYVIMQTLCKVTHVNNFMEKITFYSFQYIHIYIHVIQYWSSYFLTLLPEIKPGRYIIRASFVLCEWLVLLKFDDNVLALQISERQKVRIDCLSIKRAFVFQRRKMELLLFIVLLLHQHIRPLLSESGDIIMIYTH